MYHASLASVIAQLTLTLLGAFDSHLNAFMYFVINYFNSLDLISQSI